MAIRPRGNVPPEALRWTIERASIEFATTQDTLKKSLSQASVSCGPDGCYSTAEICQGLFGLMHQEKIATQKEIRKRYTLENQITTASVLNRAELSKGFGALADAISGRVMASGELSRATKEDILKDLASWPLILVQ